MSSDDFFYKQKKLSGDSCEVYKAALSNHIVIKKIKGQPGRIMINDETKLRELYYQIGESHG